MRGTGYSSASITASWGFHFLPHLMVLFACQTFPSSDKNSLLTAHALVALNSSTTETGKWGLEALLYRLTELKDGWTPSHFCTNLLHRHHTLNLPSSWLLSIALSQVFSWALVLSFRELLKFFPRHWIPCFWIVGTSAPLMLKMFLVDFLFRMLRLLDFSGLSCIGDHVTIFSSALRIHCVSWSDGVIMVTSSMKARQAGCLIPSSVFGPLAFLLPSVVGSRQPQTRPWKSCIPPWCPSQAFAIWWWSESMCNYFWWYLIVLQYLLMLMGYSWVGFGEIQPYDRECVVFTFGLSLTNAPGVQSSPGLFLLLVLDTQVSVFVSEYLSAFWQKWTRIFSHLNSNISWNWSNTAEFRSLGTEKPIFQCPESGFLLLLPECL